MNDKYREASFFQRFSNHPASVGESYFEHMRFACWFSLQLLVAGGAALVHAIIPPLFEHTAGNRVRRLFNTIEKRDSH
ncbi:hypothetical protein AB833_11665 [Chromatiales bacterium (ex Bugula neritina AB1)]|nr:hypothetical protein AB833_11665 [Chromatiales bacterium (ex Bugula neritina AB1)]